MRNATHAHTVAATPAALTTLRSAGRCTAMAPLYDTLPLFLTLTLTHTRTSLIAAAGRLLHTSTKLATAKNRALSDPLAFDTWPVPISPHPIPRSLCSPAADTHGLSHWRVSPSFPYLNQRSCRVLCCAPTCASIRHPIPAPGYSCSSHPISSHQAERLVSVALVPIIGAAFIVPGTAVDMALAVSVPVHNWM